MNVKECPECLSKEVIEDIEDMSFINDVKKISVYICCDCGYMFDLQFID